MNGIDQDRLLLADLCKWSGLSPSRLGEEAGLSPTTITRTTSGTATSRLSTPTFEKLKRRFPDFPGWDAKAFADRRPAGRRADSELEPSIEYVAQIDLRFGLGAAIMDQEIVEDDAEKLPFPSDWLRMISTSPASSLYWAKGQGNSMEPTIRDDEVILIDRSQRNPTFGDLYWAVAYGQVSMIKRLRPMPDGSVRILSDNKDVEPEVAYDGELHVFGRVVAVVRRL